MSEKMVRRALLANAAFSTLASFTLLLFSHFIADLVGSGAPVLYQLIGGGLLAFASFVLWTATRRPINTFAVLQISVADLLWVIGTGLIILIAYPALHPEGIITMLVVAGVVLAFAVSQWQGIGAVYAVTGKSDTHRLCVSIDTPEAMERMWPIIADLASIKDYSPTLTRVILRNNAKPGVDAVRQCTDAKNKTWAEHCTRYDPATHAIDMKFLADEPGFPYPFKTMNGGWQVVPTGNGSTVKVWFEVTPKYRLLHPLILAMMAKDLDKSFGELVARMVIAARGQRVPDRIAPAQHGVRHRLANC